MLQRCIHTVVLGPGVTSHSELSPEALREAGIASTTIRIAVGDEDPRRLLAQFIHAASLAIDRFYGRTWMKFQRSRLRSGRRTMAVWLGEAPAHAAR